jgi:hypothetical protein
MIIEPRTVSVIALIHHHNAPAICQTAGNDPKVSRRSEQSVNHQKRHTAFAKHLVIQHPRLTLHAINGPPLRKTAKALTQLP